VIQRPELLELVIVLLVRGLLMIQGPELVIDVSVTQQPEHPEPVIDASVIQEAELLEFLIGELAIQGAEFVILVIEASMTGTKWGEEVRPVLD
jgi:hypothetical protein